MRDKSKIFPLLLISVILFFAFGFYHITKFETTDEHLWKYGRIKQYWQAIGDRDWKETYINDKPGVTIALFSGAGLLFEPNPENHRTKDKVFKTFDTEKTGFINLIFRLPILILATLSLFMFFWLAWKAFNSGWLALFATMFLALNPILIGITQIINPDSFLWIFGGLSVFSYLAFLNKKEKKFLILTGIFTGFAMLSKYTALTLFVFYFLSLFAKMIYVDKDKEESRSYKYIFKEIFHIFLVFIITLAVFVLFLPAIFVEPSYLTKGVFQFFKRGNFNMLIPVFVIFLGLIAYFRKNFFKTIMDFFVKYRHKILIIACSFFALVVLALLIDVWTGQKIVPLDALRDAAYANEPKKFNFGKMLKNISFMEKNGKLFLLEAYPFIFSLTSLSFFLLIFLLAKAIFKKVKDNSSAILFSTIIFTIIYFIMTIMVRVVANIRYSMILQFLFAIISAVAVIEILDSLKLKEKKYYILSAGLILIFSACTLWSARPFYFSYENPLLPKKFTINSSWGSGFYEAAQYLNSKPDAENLIIWSNSTTICPFFKGKCIDSRKINLDIAKPDYFVISKRGEIKVKNRFVFINPGFKGKPSDYYFENLKNNYEWAIFINDRKENFVKIVKFED